MKSAASTAEHPILEYSDSLGPSGDLPPLEALFRNTVEQAPVGIAFASRDGAYRYCNRAFCAMLGFAPEELSNSSIASLTLSEDRAATTAGLDRLWRGEIGHLDVEKRYVRKDGSALWVRVSTSLVRRRGEEAVCSVEFLRDISVRKEMAAALVQKETLLATVIAELPLALIACDVTGRMTHYNRAAIELFGIPAGDAAALARNPYPITSEVYRADRTTPVPNDERPLARALRGDEVSDAEFVVIRPDGAARTALSSARRPWVPPDRPSVQSPWFRTSLSAARPMRSSSRCTGSCWSPRDTPAWPRWRPTCCTTSAMCSTASMSPRALIAERIMKSKCARLGQLAALLKTHAADLAGFLAGPQGKHLPEYLQELAGDLAGERDLAVEELTALRSNVEHIKEIVAMQQSYARRGGGTETLDIRVLAEDSLRMNEGAFSRHGVTIVRDYQDVPPIEVDKHKVLQILVNVIRNAKYACHEATSEKTVTVRIRAGNGSVLVSVIDTGVGIPRANLERIFSHGFTTRADGHGFGLHSSALAAQALGGTLQAESAGPGRGATFTLTLPLRSPESRDAN